MTNPSIEHCQFCGRGRYLGRDAFFCECGEPFQINLPQLQRLKGQVGKNWIMTAVTAEGETTWTAPHGWTQLAENALANHLQDSAWLRVARSATLNRLPVSLEGM